MIKTISKYIFAVDPSSTKTGYAFLRCAADFRGDIKLLDRGVIKPKGNDEQTRFQFLEEELSYLLQSNEPDNAVFEKANPVYRNRPYNRRNHLKYVQAVHLTEQVLNNALGARNVYGVYPETWKQTEKKYITVRRANLLFHLNLDEKKDHDIADAIMLGVFFIERQRVPESALPPVLECTC